MMAAAATANHPAAMVVRIAALAVMAAEEMEEAAAIETDLSLHAHALQ